MRKANKVMRADELAQSSSTSIPRPCEMAYELKERERLLQSVITSQALEGVHVDLDEAATLLDEAQAVEALG